MYNNLKSEHYLTGDSEIKQILSTKSEIGKLISLTNENNFNMTFLNSSGSNIFNGIFNKAKKDNKSMWLLQPPTFADNAYVAPGIADVNVQSGGGGGGNDEEIPEHKQNEEILDPTTNQLVDLTRTAEYDIELTVSQHTQPFQRIFNDFVNQVKYLQTRNPQNNEMRGWIQQAETAQTQTRILTYSRANLNLLEKALQWTGWTAQGQSKFTKTARMRGNTRKSYHKMKFKKYVD